MQSRWSGIFLTSVVDSSGLCCGFSSPFGRNRISFPLKPESLNPHLSFFRFDLLTPEP